MIAGMVGCFGGMAIAAGLCSHVVMTREGRLGLNGPQVIEQEAGVAELDSEDRRLVWETIGGEQRVATGMADALVEDDVAAIARRCGPRSKPEHPWSTAAHRSGITKPGWPVSTRPIRSTARRCAPCGQSRGMAMSRGRTWFEALGPGVLAGEPASVLCADGAVGGERARFWRSSPIRRRSSPGAWRRAGPRRGLGPRPPVREAVVEDGDGDRRALVAVVDVPGQPYGYREELLGLHLALAAAVDAYATARLAGHPVVALVVGQAISGAFLAHGMQANRILALEDPGVAVQVMSKRSTARVTRRSVEELDEIAEEVPATAYDVASFARLGALHRLIEGSTPPNGLRRTSRRCAARSPRRSSGPPRRLYRPVGPARLPGGPPTPGRELACPGAARRGVEQ